MGAPAPALAALEVAVAGAGAALPGLEDVGVHPQAHRAAGVAPLRAGGAEDPVEALRLGLSPDLRRSGHHQDTQPALDGPALEHGCGDPKVLDTAVGAGADEDGVDGDVLDGRPRDQVHVGKCAASRLPSVRVAEALRVGHVAGDRHRLRRGRPPGDGRLQRGRVDDDGLVVPGTGVAAQLAPGGHRGLPVRTAGREGSALDVGEGGRIRSDHPGPPPTLDGEVAEGHPLLHGEVADGRSRVLDDVAGGTGGADGVEHAEGHVLGGDPGRQRTLDPHLQRPGTELAEALGRQHVLDLGGPDPQGEGAEGAVGRGVGVAADDHGAGQGQAQLGPDDVHDALPPVPDAVAGDARLVAVAAKRLHLGPADLVRAAQDVLGGGDVVIHGGDDLTRPAHLPSLQSEPLERLR